MLHRSRQSAKTVMVFDVWCFEFEIMLSLSTHPHSEKSSEFMRFPCGIRSEPVFGSSYLSRSVPKYFVKSKVGKAKSGLHGILLKSHRSLKSFNLLSNSFFRHKLFKLTISSLFTLYLMPEDEHMNNYMSHCLANQCPCSARKSSKKQL